MLRNILPAVAAVLMTVSTFGATLAILGTGSAPVASQVA